MISKKRGKPAHNATTNYLKSQIVTIYRTHLWDHGPALAARVLRDEFAVTISREGLRQILIAEGLWIPKQKRSERVHPRRPREECFGGLIQIDGTKHFWLPGEEEFCLLVFVDDATSRLMHLSFAREETSQAYLDSWKEYLREHGRPIRVYADGHAALFRQSGTRRENGEDEFTSDLARALKALNIGRERSIEAQGRGRVERMNSTLQDHLPKFLRRHGATTIGAANDLLPSFIAQHNREFSVTPKSPVDRHRPLPRNVDLDLVFSEQSERKLSRSLTISYASDTLALYNSETTRGATGHFVTVHRLTDGTIKVSFRGELLPHWIVDEFNPRQNNSIILPQERGGTRLQ